jgi:patatin-like phospholipase/acyl hydrolase
MSEDAFYEEDNRKRLTIEHIIPQNPEEKMRVLKNKNIIPEFTDEFTDEYLHSVGNLTIDPLSPNIQKSNHDFQIKNLIHFKKAPLMCQNELEDFLNPKTKKFDSFSIEKRREKIIGFAVKEWKYDKI